MRTLITNCPNCAGELTKDGKCLYCGTHVRLANEIDISADNSFGCEPIELTLNIKRGDEVLVLPLVGRIDSLTVSSNDHTVYCDYVPYVTLAGYPLVEFNFSGRFNDDFLTRKIHSIL